MKVLNREWISCRFPFSSSYCDRAGEDLVLAVLGPGLGQASSSTSVGSAPSPTLRRSSRTCGIAVMGLDDPHLVQGQGQHPFPADPHQFVVGDLQVDLAAPRPVVSAGTFGTIDREAPLGRESGGTRWLVALDQGVAEKAGGDRVPRQQAESCR